MSRLGAFMRVRSTVFLGLLLVIILAYPWFADGSFGAVFFTAATVFIVIGGLVEMRNERRWFFPAIVLALPTGILSLIETIRISEGYPALFLLHGTMYGLLAANFVVFALKPGKVSGEKLSAIINGYLMLGFAWATFYRLIYLWEPGAFLHASGEELHAFDFLYFSFVTLTTLGYGDISPVSDRARAFAIVEAVFGTMYMVVLVSRLVSDFGRLPSRHSEAGDPAPESDPEESLG